jgi:Icc-related predicted phosphoesterase
MASEKETVRLAAVGDIHVSKTSQGALQPLIEAVNQRADVLLLLGDLTDYGTQEEAQILVKELSSARVPVVAVLGNHDFESEQPDRVAQIICDAGITLLDGEVTDVNGIGFAGAKGFCGGFGARSLEPWGEPAIKAFVQEAQTEAMKLEKALARLRTPEKVALLHYAPIAATVEGEPCEIWSFLGSSRLEEPINRFGATLVLHGHAHHGSPEGRTSGGIPVYNVSMPLLKRRFPDEPPFRLIELPVQQPAAA